MKWLTRRKIRRRLKPIRWDLLELDPSLKEYRETSGEYAALMWMKAYLEGRAACEPMYLVKAILRSGKDSDMGYTILDTIT